jgi:hypothetical protein
MTDIAIRNGAAVDIQPGQDQAVARLAEWAQVADAAYAMATKLVGTSFAPQAYRGKPEEATAAILAGAEVGLAPMAALRAFDNIQGTPAPKAITLRAIVQAQGHDIRIDESTPVLASVSGRRKDGADWQTSTWTIERAEQMGLTTKAQWKQQPAAMLVARATAEVCRWVASDAIMGMPYSAEEVRDEGDGFQPRPRAQRVTAAEILGTTDTPDGDTPEAESDRLNEHQRRTIFALLGDRGITDRDQRLAGISKVVGREVATMNDLTSDEADHVIAVLRRATIDAPPAEPVDADWPPAAQPPDGTR